MESELACDGDDDGFYHAFTLHFIPRIDRGHLDARAEIYISFEGGPWKHHATSRLFTVFADAPNHGYVIGSILDLGGIHAATTMSWSTFRMRTPDTG